MRKLTYLLVTAIFLFTACDDDAFLNQNPHSPTDKSFYQSEAGAVQGIIAAYDVLQFGEWVERTELRGTVCSGDAMAGGEPGGFDQQSLQDYMKFIIFPSNLYVRDYWQLMYRGIYRANQVIRYLEGGKDDPTMESFDEALRTRLVAEAKFLRGLYHFKLQVNYGGFSERINDEYFGGEMMGVPFVETILPPDGGGMERPALAETWAKIEQDFLDASSKLPERSELAATDIGRATKGAALSMLAKTYLYQEKWADAYAQAKKVIESGEYWLEGDDSHPGPYTIQRPVGEEMVTYNVSGYKYIWQPEANNCGESVFDSQHFQEGSTRYPQGQEGNLVPRYYGPRALVDYLDISVPDRTDGATDTTLMQETEYYWGFILPTDYFVETAYADIGCEVGDEILDPRYKLSVVENEDPMPVGTFTVEYRFTYDDDNNPATPRKIFSETVPYTHGDSLGYAGWYNWPCTGRCTWKYFTDPLYGDAVSTLGDYPQNNKMIRFADVLLMGAEAAVHVGQQGDADNWVNWVRERARNSGNTTYPQDVNGVTVADVLAERRVELAFEGHQFFDIVRTGRAEEILINEAMQYTPITTHPRTGEEAPQQFGNNFQLGKHEILPIPQNEIDQSNGTIAQNPKY